MLAAIILWYEPILIEIYFSPSSFSAASIALSNKFPKIVVMSIGARKFRFTLSTFMVTEIPFSLIIDSLSVRRMFKIGFSVYRTGMSGFNSSLISAAYSPAVFPCSAPYNPSIALICLFTSCSIWTV